MGIAGELTRRLAGLAAQQALDAVQRRLAPGAAGTGFRSVPPVGAPPPPAGEPAPPPPRAPGVHGSGGSVGGAAPGPVPAGPVPARPVPAGPGRGGLTRQVTDLLAAGREAAGERLAEAYGAVAARRDPARQHAKRIRRTQRRLRTRATVAGGLTVVAATAGVAPGLEAAEVGFGGAAAVVALTALAAGRRLRELRRTTAPRPRPRDLPRPKRPPWDCPARAPLDRLAARERALAGLLVHLGSAADEPRAVAADAAAALRELGDRIAAVDRARRGAAPASAAGLGAAVAGLVGQLEAGIAGYDALVVAAADAVAASATLRAGDPVLLLRLTEATDSLAGLAEGLHEIAR